MQAIRILARRVTNPKLMRQIYRPSFIQQTEDEAIEVPNDWHKRQVELEDRALSTREQIANLFHAMDADNDGFLEIDEVSKAFCTGKIPTSQISLMQLVHFSEVDQTYHSTDPEWRKQEGRMGLEEFVDLVQ